MVWTGYFSKAGVELFNEERVRTYIATMAPHLPVRDRSLDAFSGLHTAIGDAAYTTAQNDAAPWIDLSNPDTLDFLGMRIISVEGLDDATDGAAVTESLTRGGSVGDRRQSSREMRFTGILYGRTPQSVDAGLTWLRHALWDFLNQDTLDPFTPGSSDLRFFIERPEIAEQPVNYFPNPTADDMFTPMASLRNTLDVVRYPNDNGRGTGDWLYRCRARTATAAEAQLLPSLRPATAPGEKWWASASISRPTGLVGAYQYAMAIQFRDQYGNRLTSTPATVDSIPTGVHYQSSNPSWTPVQPWLAHDFSAERYSGTTKRVNVATNRTFGPSYQGDTSADPGVPLKPGGWNYTGTLGTGFGFSTTQNTTDTALPGRMGYCRLTYGSNPAAGAGIRYTGGTVGSPAGQKFNIGVYVRSSVSNAFTFRIIWLNDAGTEIVSRQYSTSFTVGTTWTYMSKAGFVMPAGATSFVMDIYPTSGAPAASSMLYATAVMAEPTTSTADLSYFDEGGNAFRTDGGGTGLETAVHNVSVSAVAPAAAVSAEVAFIRSGVYQAAVGDEFYVDQVMLVRSNATTAPPFMDTTLDDLVEDVIRVIPETYTTAGPTVIDDFEFGPDGCLGAAKQVEFTLVAENPNRYRRPQTIAVPKPSAFTAYNDIFGRVRNYAPCISVDPLLTTFVTTRYSATFSSGTIGASSGGVVASGTRVPPNMPNGNFLPGFMATSTSGSDTTIVVDMTASSSGDALVVPGNTILISGWVASDVANDPINVTAQAMRGGLIGTNSASTTVSNANIGPFGMIQDACFFQLTLNPSDSNGLTVNVELNGSTGGPASGKTVYLAGLSVTNLNTIVPYFDGTMSYYNGYDYQINSDRTSDRIPKPFVDTDELFAPAAIPPTPPAALGVNSEFGGQMMRAYVPIPAELVPTSAAGLLVFRLDVDGSTFTPVRVRLYPNPSNLAPSVVDPNSWAAEWLIAGASMLTSSSITQFFSIAVDSVSESVLLQALGTSVVVAGQYASEADGSPITYPEIRDTPWFLTIDGNSTTTPLNKSWFSAALVIEE